MLGKEQSKPKEMKKEKNRAEIMEQKTNTFQRDSKQNKKSVLETTRETSGKIFQEKDKDTNNIRNGKGVITIDPREMKL